MKVISLTIKRCFGGWKAFAEENGVNKKEEMENFDWLPSEWDKFAYVDCRQALDGVEGSREWLKTYVRSKEEYSFSCEMSNSLVALMRTGHSGASFTGLMWSYKNLLNDWDTWVFLTKKHHYRREYKQRQIEQMTCFRLLQLFEDKKDQELKEQCAMHGLARDSTWELSDIIKTILDDNRVIGEEDAREDAERAHRELIGSLEFLYKTPCRWFDSRFGCSLRPGHPSNITARAMADMEDKYPGYRKHISQVLQGIQTFNAEHRLENFDYYSHVGSEILDDFMKEQGIVV